MRMIYRFALLFSLILTAYPSIAKEAPITFAPVAKKLVQSVVNISSTQKIVTPNIEYQGNPFPFDLKGLPQGSLLEEFLNEFFGGIPPEALSPFNNSNPKRKAMSLGSGFIISEDGIIVTNNHVIDNAEQITVTFFDNTEASAKILGRDEKTDIAVLKVDKTNLTPVTFGDSDKTEIGDWVLAVGNPFGLGNTVTSGIISAKSRNIDAGPYDDFFQTDAAINRGNSGAALQCRWRSYRY
jgi:serine protease Do